MPEVVTLKDYTEDIEEEVEEEDIINSCPQEAYIYSCNYCKVCSISQNNLKNHWSSEHTSESGFK